MIKPRKQPPTMTKKKPTPPAAPTMAEYQGAISRWCSLHNLVPDCQPSDSRAMMEFETFNSHLSDVQKSRTETTTKNTPDWSF